MKNFSGNHKPSLRKGARGEAKKALVLSMALVTAGTSVFGAGCRPILAAAPVKKEEAVFITLDEHSQVSDSIVSVWLHSDDGFNDFRDPSNLKNIIDLTDDEKVKFKEGKLEWNTEKKDIYYQGQGKKELPVDISLKYELDGKEIKKEDLKGKSGNLKLTIHFTNRDFTEKVIEGKKTKVYTPYYISTVINFDESECDNVKTNTGKVVNDGSKIAVLAAAFPGLYETVGKDLDDLGIDVKKFLPDEIEITARVKDYHPTSPLFALSQDLPFDEKLKEMNSIDELEDGIHELEENGDKLLDGAQKLYDGNEELSESVDDLADGAKKLNDGAKDAKKGSKELLEKMVEILDGADKLK